MGNELTWKEGAVIAILTVILMGLITGAWADLWSWLGSYIRDTWQRIVDARTERHNRHLTLSAVQALRVVRGGKVGDGWNVAEGDIYAPLPPITTHLRFWGCSNPTRRNIPEDKILKYYRRGILEACTYSAAEAHRQRLVLRRSPRDAAFGALDLSSNNVETQRISLSNGGSSPEAPGTYLVSVNVEPSVVRSREQWGEAALEISRANMQPETPRTSLSEALDNDLVTGPKVRTKKELLEEDPFDGVA